MAFNLSTEQRNIINSGMSDLHDLFAKELYYRKESTETVITENPNHNYFFDGAPSNTTTQTTINTGSFTARIYWGKQELKELDVGENFNSKAYLPDGWVRIITTESGKNIVEDSKRFRFEDELYELESNRERHGLLQKNFFEYNFKPAT